MFTVIDPIANNTVVADATLLDGVRVSNHHRFPDVNASNINTATIVPQLLVLSTNVTEAALTNEALLAVPQLDFELTRATLAYAPPDGSVDPVPSMAGVVVDNPK